MINHEVEMKNKIERIVCEFIKELHSTVDTEVDFFYINEDEIKGPQELIELVEKSSFFNTSNEEEIIRTLNNQILYRNFYSDVSDLTDASNNDGDADVDNDNIEFDDSLKYFNYLFLDDSGESKEKILFLFTFQGFRNETIETYRKGTSYSFLRFLLNEIFQQLRFEKISSILDEKVYGNKSDALSVFIRNFTDNLVRNVCDVENNNLFNELYYISSLSYEGSSVSAKLMILNEKNMHAFIDFFIKLHNKVKYEEHRKIRKIMEISSSDMYLIGDDKYVYGIGRARKFDEMKELEIEKKMLVIDFMGKFEYSLNTINISKNLIKQSEQYFEDIRWSWNEINCVQIKYGKPSLQENQFSIEALSDEIKKSFNDYFQEQEYTKGDIKGRVSKIINIVEQATKQKHGAILVIAKPDLARGEIERLENQSIKIIETDLVIQERKNTSDSIIERITSIDGALYLDIEGYCHAMGVILDGIAEKEQGDSSRGSRYNSAIKYYNKDNVKGNCVIVIISEDGMVDIIPDSKKDAKEVNKIKNELKSLIRESDFKQALDKVEQLLRFNDPLTRSYAYNLKVFLLSKIEGFSKKLIELCTESIRLNEKNVLAYLRRALVYGKLEEPDRAIDDYTKVIELDEKNKIAFNNRGSHYAYKKEYEKAIEDYTKAINIDENYAGAYFNRGKVYVETENYEKAIDDHCQAIKIDRKLVKAYKNLIIIFDKLIKINPEKEADYKSKIEEIKSIMDK